MIGQRKTDTTRKTRCLQCGVSLIWQQLQQPIDFQRDKREYNRDMESPPPSTSHFLFCAAEDHTEKKQVGETLPYCLKHSLKCSETPSDPQDFFSAALTILTSLGVHILKLANEEENWALHMCLSYGNEFSASEVMLGITSEEERMHEEGEILDKHASDLTSSVLAQCFCSELFKLDTAGFKESIS